MAKRKSNLKNGVKFGSGQPTNLGGRKKGIYTILKDKGFAKADVTKAFTEMLFYNIDELNEVLDDKTKPIIMLLVASSLKAAFEEGDYKKGQQIIEQVIGRALQRTELTGKMENSINFVVAGADTNIESDEID